MKIVEENVYWIAVAHLPRWTNERINRLVVRVIHEFQLSLSEFFSMSEEQWDEILDFTPAEKDNLKRAVKDMPRLTFIAEQLFNEGFQLMPVSNPDYPQTLKENLQLKYAPPLLYLKGKSEILNEEAIAIVGSRNAGANALIFTREMARKAAKTGKVVVSGFARGVDQEALLCVLEAGGKSIVVLPQGILTFHSGFKKFYQPIVEGNLLVLSAFFPKTPWDVGLAMARNAYIYGLAKEIYVAESDFKGGTWQGVVDGLKRGRLIFVRVPELTEKNANMQLMDMGAKPVDAKGTPQNSKVRASAEDSPEKSEIRESSSVYSEKGGDTVKDILQLLKTGTFTASQIKSKLALDWDVKKLSNFLKKHVNVQTLSGRPLRFTLKTAIMKDLFDKESYYS